MNRMIERGGALGYDVKGCKCSLRKMINGIDVGLIDLPMGVRMYTRMSKTGSKLSTLDRFLISDGILLAHSYMQVSVLDRVWSNHNPILLHCTKFNFGLIPFKLFHSWFDRNGLDDVVKEAWKKNSIDVHGSVMSFHDELRGLKAHCKLWYSRTNDCKYSRKKSILDSLRTLDEKIDACRANEEDRDLHVNTLLELDGLEKLESMDLIPQA
nr:RNA-directed DNA polymerase, eukaryota, reverse transcriptase zinc-binding domain protein [Tanacetum cinerariifolium]